MPAAKKAAAKKAPAKKATARAARTDAPVKAADIRRDLPAQPEPGDLARQTAAAARKERAGVAPDTTSGRLVESAHPEAKAVDLSKVIDDDADVLVTLKQDVYEEVPIPGAPGRFSRQLRYRRGQRVSRKALDAHVAAQEQSGRRNTETK